MKKLLACLIGLLAISGSVAGQDADSAITIGNKIQLESAVLEETRELWISTPRFYEDGEESYPVLFLLDGDFHFQHTTATIDFLSRNGRIPEMITIAILNTDRNRDFTPSSQNSEDIEQVPTKGGANNFLRFISEELIPYVEKNYRTKPFKILVGHSRGGLFAIHTLISQPEIFDAYIAISPSLQWSDQRLIERAEAFFEATPELQVDLYLTTGNEGQALTGGTRKLAGILEENAPKGFRWDINLMVEETHGSVPHPSTYQGLQSIYRGWNLHDLLPVFDIGGVAAIKRYYKDGGNRFGYERSVPASAIEQLIEQLINSRRLDAAAAVLLRESDTPPSSYWLDRMANVYAEEGKQDSARDLYTRSLTNNPGNFNAKEKLIKMGVDVEKLVPKIKVAAELLQNYTGKYEFEDGLILNITLSDSILFSQEAGGQVKFELLPVTEKRFAAVGLDAQLEFNDGQEKEARSATLFQHGQEWRSRRID